MAAGAGTRARAAGRAPGVLPAGGEGVPGGDGVPHEGIPHPHVAEIQRSRLLAAAVRTVDELGYSQATVAHITHRARVSRRTFYELFANREECLIAALESVVEGIRDELAAAGVRSLPWREQIRAGLGVILAFFDREPVLARVCVVQALRGSQRVLERREEILAGLAGVVDQGRDESSRGGECPPSTAEGLVGAAFALVYSRLLRNDREPLTDLVGDLMGMIVLPYMGPTVARKERSRGVSATRAGKPTRRSSKGGSHASPDESEHGDPLAGIPMRLTYRTVRVLEAIAAEPGVSNRGVGERAGVSDQGQISKLLARLERLGLASNEGAGHLKGEPNAWVLTTTGRRVAQTIRMHTNDHERAA
jgi:AcrR family transcriptional regulator